MSFGDFRLKVKIWLALISLYIVWGSTYLAIRFAVETIPPFLMAGTRNLTAGLILYVWMRVSKKAKPTWSEWKTAGIIGLFLLVGGNGLVSWSEQRVVSSIAAVIVGSMPLWIVLIDAVRPGGSKPFWLTVVGVVLGFVGILILVNPFGSSNNDSNAVDTIGAIALLIASLLWSIGSIYGRENHHKLPNQPLLASGMEMLVGGVGLFIVGTLAGEWGRLNIAEISISSIVGLVYLIFFGSIVGFASYSWLLGVAPTPLVATYAYVNPLVAVFLGSIIANEPMNFQIIFSALLIVGAVLIINTTSWLRSMGRLRSSTIQRGHE